MTQVSSFYLHVPFCRHLCNYCDFYKKKFDAPQKLIEDFHQTLSQELIRHDEFMKEHDMRWASLETVYFGGGTPSLWGEEGAAFFESSPFGKLAKNSDLEFTMEVDPGTWSDRMIQSWKKLGLNRISIGTQSLDAQFLKVLDREHGLDESFALLSYCQQHDWNFSLDFLLGVPFSKEKNRKIERELERLLEFRPKHISLYILNARSKYPHISSMPDDEFIREEYLFVSEFLQSKGFHHYEVSNFARPGFESKHNMKYWKSESVAAFGPTGTGLFKLSNEKAIRYKWKVSRPEVEIEVLKKEELELEQTYLELRTSQGWVPRQMTPQIANLFETWTSLKYGHWDGKKMKLNSLGFLMLDSLMDDLFRLPAAR